MTTRTNFGEEMDSAELEAVSGGVALGLLPAVVSQRNANGPTDPQYGGAIGWRSGGGAPEPDHTALYVNAAVQLFQSVMRGYGHGGSQSQGYGYDAPQATYGADDYDRYDGYDSYDRGFDDGGFSDDGYGLGGI